MADKSRKVPGSAPGKYYIDDSCVTCVSCLDEAPDLIKLTDDEKYAYFVRQPETDAEVELAKEAMDSCPTGAVGDDGE